MTRLVNPRSLTPGERLMIDRRRREESQVAAARRWRVAPDRYKRWETGRYEGPTVQITRLKPHEECFILRQRATMSRSDLAEALGVSLSWTTDLERGRVPVDRLLTYWRERESRRRRRD